MSRWDKAECGASLVVKAENVFKVLKKGCEDFTWFFLVSNHGHSIHLHVVEPCRQIPETSGWKNYPTHEYSCDLRPDSAGRTDNATSYPGQNLFSSNLCLSWKSVRHIQTESKWSLCSGIIIKSSNKEFQQARLSRHRKNMEWCHMGHWSHFKCCDTCESIPG